MPGLAAPAPAPAPAHAPKAKAKAKAPAKAKAKAKAGLTPTETAAAKRERKLAGIAKGVETRKRNAVAKAAQAGGTVAPKRKKDALSKVKGSRVVKPAAKSEPSMGNGIFSLTSN